MNGPLDCIKAALDFGSWRHPRRHVPDAVYRSLPWNRTAYFPVGVLAMTDYSEVPYLLKKQEKIKHLSVLLGWFTIMVKQCYSAHSGLGNFLRVN
jgi:hypothetical protein